jgi:7-carboxy-7-deazaguanine synthase
MVAVNEIFGPTVQGEGKYVGRHCMFVRLWGCNLTCAWCDTPYTWAYTPERSVLHQSRQLFPKEENCQEMNTVEVMWKLGELWPVTHRGTIIVFSGGEPLMQQAALVPLFETLSSYGNAIHIETAGTIKPLPFFDACVDAYTVSPKLANSGNVLNKRYKPDVIERFADSAKTTFKFVVTMPSDLQAIDEMSERHAIHPSRIYCMPEGTSLARNLDVARTMAEWVLARGYNLSPRWHIALWGDERGR